MMNRTMFCLLALVLNSTPSAQANDTSAEISAGGLVFTKQESIRMNKEDLYISKAKVEVSYEFANPTQKLISTEVAFPLPPYEYSESQFPRDSSKFKGLQIQANDPSFLDFTAEVDGHPIKLEIDAKAYLKEKEITAKLKELGVDVLSVNKAGAALSGNESWAKAQSVSLLPPEKVAEAFHLGFIDSIEHAAPIWVVKATFHWKQEFPAGKTVHIKHVYRPELGHSGIGPASSYKYLGKGAVECLSTPEAAKIRAETKSGEFWGYANWVRYILVTAKNWNGPIGQFSLTVEKESDELMSTSFRGLKPEGEKTFKFSKKNFVPSKNLLMCFYKRA